MEPTFGPEVKNPHNHKWIFNPINRCKRDKPKLLILIKTTEETYAVREMVRKTWCQNSGNEFKIITFLLRPTLSYSNLRSVFKIRGNFVHFCHGERYFFT